MMTYRRDFLKTALIAFAPLGSSSVACKKRSAEVVVYTSVDQVFAEPIFRAIEAKTGLTIRAVFDTEETKSTGVLNRIITEASNPQADIFWSGDPVRPFLLMKRGLVEPYRSPEAEAVPESFRAKDGMWSAIGARARVLLLNSPKIPGLRPMSVRDLADPRWKGQTAMANPLFGTTTMHMAALATSWGDDALKAFLTDAKSNGMRVAASNGEVKRLVVAGEVAFGLTDSDDADEAIKEGIPVSAVVPDQLTMGALIVPTSVVRIRKSPHPDTAGRVVDALLTADTERRLAESGAHMPLRADTVVPKRVQRAHQLRPMTVDYAKVAEAMDRLQPWLKQWAGL